MNVGFKLNLSLFIIIGLMILTTIIVFTILPSVESKQQEVLDSQILKFIQECPRAISGMLLFFAESA